MNNEQINDLNNEMSQNFIDYAFAVNTDRSIPNATDGLKPVAKRILYGAFDCGFNSEKPHVKCANIVGNVMADFHPHGDSSIYGALVRLSQPWVMRYPLIDFHGSNGNIDGDGPAAYRYTEAKLSKFTEEGMLAGIKKNNVDFIPNYSETKEEPVELPAIFPNLLCNPNSGIGVAIASSWGCHNLKEVAQAIYDYLDGKEPMIYPDFPTGGIIINKQAIPAIMKTGHGSVKIRGKYNIEKENMIVFTELPYGVGTEALMTQIGEACENNEVVGVADIRNESNKKGFRLVIECTKTANIKTVINQLFAKTNLQTSFSYNQVALVEKTPTELNLIDCIKIYLNHNTNCIKREMQFDIKKTEDRLHIINGLIKALDIIDDIIQMIKQSSSSAVAKETLQTKWDFTETQAKAIMDMKLAKLAKLEKEELIIEKAELEQLLITLTEIYNNPIPELRKRLQLLVDRYGDDRRTELTQLADTSKEEKEIEAVVPEQVMVITTKAGNIKRIPISSYKVQRRNTKGLKNQADITSMTLRTNTVDRLMVFSDKGKLYTIVVDEIPAGTNASAGVPITSLVQMDPGEKPTIIYSIYKDTTATHVLFVTKKGLIKRTPLSEYTSTKRKGGVKTTTINDDDELVSVSLIKDEELLLLSKKGFCIHIKSSDISEYGKVAKGVKGMNLAKDDEIITCLPIRDKNDKVAIFDDLGCCKKVPLSDFSIQARGGKGLVCGAKGHTNAAAVLVSDDDTLLVTGDKTSMCVSAKELATASRTSVGTQVIKGNHLVSVTKA